MNVIDIMNPPEAIWIGRKGENVFREVSIDCSGYIEKHPNATITAMYQSGENEPFPVVLEQNGNTFTWKPRSEEITDEYGRIEIVLTDGEAVGASKIVECFVDESLIDGTEHPAESAPAWSVEMVQDVTEQADRAEAAVSHYPQIVNGYWWVWDVEFGEFVSTGISAQGEDGVSPTVTVEAIEGGHRVTITDADGPHTFDVMDGEGGSGSGAVESVNGMTGVVILDANDVGAVSTETYATDMSQVSTELSAKLNTADLQTELDDNVPPARFVLARNGNTLSTVDTFISIATPLISTPRRVMFIIVVSQSGGAVTSALEMYPTMVDANSRQLTLVGYFDGNRYTAELTAASASSTMTGTLAVEPIVTEADIPTAVSDLTNDSGYQTASDVQAAISGVRQLPTGGSTGDFLRKDSDGNAAWETIPTYQGGSY